MKIGKIFQIPLATKCQILFGVAVILIIIAALVVPWYFMGILVRELNVSVAKQVALTVRSHYGLQTTDWDSIQVALDRGWPGLSRDLGLAETVPRLIYVGGCDGSVPADISAFELAAIEQLCSNPTLPEAQEIESVEGIGRVTHYALAVRSIGVGERDSGLLGLIVVSMASQEIWSFTNLYQIVMIGAALVAGLLAIVVFYLITQYLILSPVRALKNTSKRIVSGETNLRAEIDTGDEFEDLGNAFNDMLTHLNDSQDELRKMNRSLDIKLGELAETNVSLFEANRLKSEFLANVSHELRTPLTSIIGFAELLRDAVEQPTSTNPGKVKRFCNNILTSGRMLLDLINNLLDLTKIEAGKMKLHLTEFPLKDICEAVVDFTRPLVDKGKLDVAVHVEPDLPLVRSDAGKVQQIFYNLMSNAIKFTPPGGRIDIRVTAGGSEDVVFSVKDTGPGIARELQEHIFEKFRQLDGSVTRQHGGTGLGLAISRDLAQLLGGEISVISDVDQGAEFVVRLPIQSPEQVDVPLIRLN